jgi:hypothetical protein
MLPSGRKRVVKGLDWDKAADGLRGSPGRLSFGRVAGAGLGVAWRWCADDEFYCRVIPSSFTRSR